MSKQLFQIAATLMATSMTLTPAMAATPDSQLVTPRVLIVDKSLPPTTAAANVLAARRYDTFWNTGDEALARAGLSPQFVDGTLPPGRVQGIEGPLQASKGFRTAVPDLTCDVEQMLVVGDRVVAHLHFYGHFTGSFKRIKGKGQTINFIATDIYRVVDGQIVENWHLEDNYTLLDQLGLMKQ